MYILHMTSYLDFLGDKYLGVLSQKIKHKIYSSQNLSNLIKATALESPEASTLIPIWIEQGDLGSNRMEIILKISVNLINT